MAKTRISTLNLRIHPALKDAVREAAAREHRSVANMVEVLIRRHCDQPDRHHRLRETGAVLEEIEWMSEC
jgi:hypothetical protein